jgi:hypothetical protein
VCPDRAALSAGFYAYHGIPAELLELGYDLVLRFL